MVVISTSCSSYHDIFHKNWVFFKFVWVFTPWGYPDLGLLQGLFDILPFTSNDLEAWCALWTSILRVLVRVREDQIRQYVFLLLSKSDLIEDNASDDQFDKKKENESLATCCRTSSARTSAVSFWFDFQVTKTLFCRRNIKSCTRTVSYI